MGLWTNIFAPCVALPASSGVHQRPRFANQRRAAFDAFVRTPYTKPLQETLVRPPIGKPAADAALLAAPDNPGARQYAIFLASNRFRLDWALAILDHRATVLPDADTLAWRGAVKMLLRRRDAVIDLEQALLLSPNNRFARLVLCSCWIRDGIKINQCEREISSIVAFDPYNQHAVLVNAMFLYKNSRDQTKIRKAFQNVLDINPKNDYALAALAIIFCNDGDAISARNYAVSAMHQNSTNLFAIGVLRRTGAHKRLRLLKNPWDKKRDLGWTVDELLDEPLWSDRHKLPS